MLRRGMVQSTYFTLAILCCLLCSTDAKSGKRNVLLIVGDDAGLQLRAYNNTAIKMPNMDALTDRSLVFKHGFTSVSSCSPSRSVILSGLPQHQNGMFGLLGWFRSFDGVRSLPNILKPAGIRTGIIGKKHVGPESVYTFDYEQTEFQHNMNQIGRNITFMNHYVREFLRQNYSRPFLLYIGIHDIHRFGYTSPEPPPEGYFCENFGDGTSPGMGRIPDWKPTTYSPDDVHVPYFLPDTPVTRQEIANMYKTYSRFDQGVGLFLSELKEAGFADDTLVIYTADNGIPFTMAKTNLYDPGMSEPFLIHHPYKTESWGKKTDALASTMDLVPTILDWFDVKFPEYKLSGVPVKLTGKSLLPVIEATSVNKADYGTVYSSHTHHEATMYYPMRVIRTDKFKLIHNLNFQAPYPLAIDLYMNPTFLDILNRTISGQPLPWDTTLQKYYYRDQWQLYDLESDQKELTNLASNSKYKEVFRTLQKQLQKWQEETRDMWKCQPTGEWVFGPCYSLHNGINPTDVYSP